MSFYRTHSYWTKRTTLNGYSNIFHFRKKEFIKDYNSANLACCQYLLFDTKKIKRLNKATLMMTSNKELGPRHPYCLLNHNSSYTV